MPNQREEKAFKLANAQLQALIPKTTTAQLQLVVIPNFDDFTSVEERVAELEKCLDTFVMSRKDYITNQSRMQVVKSTVLRWFRDSYPFAQLLLGIAKEAAAVYVSSR